MIEEVESNTTEDLARKGLIEKPKKKKNKPHYELKFLIFGTKSGFAGSLVFTTLSIVLNLVGIIALPITLANSVWVILSLTGTIASFWKYLGRGLDSFRKEDTLTNQRLAALVGFFAGLALAILILFFPPLAFIPMGILGLFAGLTGLSYLATGFTYLITLVALPNIMASAADKYGQFLDYYTSKTIFDFFRWIKKKLGFKVNPKSEAEDIEKTPVLQNEVKSDTKEEELVKEKVFENRGLILGIFISAITMLAAIIASFIAISVFAITLPFSAPALGLLIGGVCIFALAFPGIACVPFKYTGRVLDLFREKVTNQKLFALGGFLLGVGIFVARFFIPGIAVLNSGITSLFNTGSNIASTITNGLGLAGIWASLFDKLGQFFDAIQKKAEKITVLDFFKRIKEKLFRRFKSAPAEEKTLSPQEPVKTSPLAPILKSSQSSTQPLLEKTVTNPQPPSQSSQPSFFYRLARPFVSCFSADDAVPTPAPSCRPDDGGSPS